MIHRTTYFRNCFGETVDVWVEYGCDGCKEELGRANPRRYEFNGDIYCSNCYDIRKNAYEQKRVNEVNVNRTDELEIRVRELEAELKTLRRR